MEQNFIKYLIFRDYPNNDCCKDMTFHIDRNDCNIKYNKVFHEYFMSTHLDSTVQGIIFCPWCGQELPKGLREEWFDTLEKEYNIEDPRDEDKHLVPEEFKTDEWWKNRNFYKKDNSQKMLVKRDILKEIYDKKITEKEAQEFINTLLNHRKVHVLDYAMIEFNPEWQAIMFNDVPFTQVATWRYEGWPTTCVMCNNSLKSENSNPIIVWQEDEHHNKKNFSLAHSNCYENNQNQ